MEPRTGEEMADRHAVASREDEITTRREQNEDIHSCKRGDDDVRISALDVLNEMDGRKSLDIKEVLEWDREEDARDLRRNELNE